MRTKTATTSPRPFFQQSFQVKPSSDLQAGSLSQGLPSLQTGASQDVFTPRASRKTGGASDLLSPVAAPANSIENLSSRLKALLNGGDAKALAEATSGKLSAATSGLSPAQQDALKLVQQAQQMDPSDRLLLAETVSPLACELASRVLTQEGLGFEKQLGFQDVIEAWRKLPDNGNELTNAASAIGMALLVLPVVAPAGVLSPTLMNPAIMNLAAFIL